MPQSQKFKVKWQKRQDDLKNFRCSGGSEVFSSDGLLVVNTGGKKQVVDFTFHLAYRHSIKEAYLQELQWN